jgi:hypothetical protein
MVRYILISSRFRGWFVLSIAKIVSLVARTDIEGNEVGNGILKNRWQIDNGVDAIRDTYRKWMLLRLTMYIELKCSEINTKTLLAVHDSKVVKGWKSWAWCWSVRALVGNATLVPILVVYCGCRTSGWTKHTVDLLELRSIVTSDRGTQKNSILPWKLGEITRIVITAAFRLISSIFSCAKMFPRLIVTSRVPKTNIEAEHSIR